MAERSVGKGSIVGAGRRSGPLDAVDLTIVGLLERDGRMSVRELAEQAHVSRANAYARLHRMEREGVIAGYAARVDPRAKGLATSAVITLQMEELRELMQGTDGYAIEQQTKRLSQVTDAFAARRMDLTVKAALSGRNLNEIEE